MANITLHKADYNGWQDALWIDQGSLTLILTPQVGGRMMGMRWQHQDLYWMNDALAAQPVDVTQFQDPRVDKRSLGFLLWGGDKTWLAPQDRWSEALPFLDLDSGCYQTEILEQTAAQLSIQMTSPVCRETQMQVTRVIDLDATEHGWRVTHKIQNLSDRTVHWGAWGNSMVRRPAQVFLPVRSDSNFPKGVKTFAQEGDAISARSQVVSALGDYAMIDCAKPIKFKYGVDSDQGAILAVLPLGEGNFLGYTKHFPAYPLEPYGHGCVAEVFNAEAYPYLELEIHGPVRPLNPGECFELEEANRLVEINAVPTTAQDINALLFPEDPVS